MDYSAILGGTAGRGTIAGVLAANLSGPRRIKAGAARDHFLGCSAVSGRGETFKSGGRVVKNVTGYDLCKLLAGSWGTLAAMTEVTIKTLPAPETEETILICGLDPPGAVAAMAAAVGSSCDVSGAAHLPAGVPAGVPGASGAAGAVTALRLEGFAPSVAHRRRTIEDLMRSFGELAAIGGSVSRDFWRAVRDVTPFAAAREPPRAVERPLWRISTAPSRGAEVGTMIARAAAARMLYDWAGGLIWLALDPSEDAGATLIRRAVAAHGGHATLVRAPASVRAAVGVFDPPDPAVAALTRRVKESFDPRRLLNPGRMWAGV
jgi:glycolate oxidase FAD binding subunit